ncbi:MAG: sigma 54-interacting transcriptional regulator [Planctomycetes bacterium]|nr:sigma 54-interacting transcriptional regulator [Planctomycetota bacterium]MCB9934802.1 sigma 54-interacting transcriptional regulator [Planctomycetota bacterium]
MPFVVVEEKGMTSHYQLVGSEASIGRAPDNTVMLRDEKASRHHCVLELQPDQTWVLRDLKSRNGTFMRGEPVLEVPIHFGETFQIGLAKISLFSEESSAFETKNAMEAIPEAARPGTPYALGIADALAGFAHAATEDTPKALLDGAAQFIGRLLPGVRVCIAVADHEGNARGRAFFNFISGTPTDELPGTFLSTANKLLSPRSRTQVKPRTANYPPCVYIPLKAGERVAGVLYVERESKEDDLSDSQAQLLEQAANLVAVLMGASESRRKEEALSHQIESFEHELAGVRRELEAKLDMQTAELTALRLEAEKREMPSWQHDYSEIIGKSAGMQEVFRMLDKITDLPVPVLILGEPGTGKELIARALHFNSSRAKTGRFVAENCAALPDTLFESELFGYVKGAFTGADRDKQGLFGLANGGTIFLDEIGEISPSMQAKLLRVIEEGEIRPIGGKQSKKVDFRLVCATNKDLAEQVRKGAFRQDLYFRINVVTIKLPPLRERKEDITVLVDHFLKVNAEQAGYPDIKMDRGVLRAMLSYNWPGNVRELENEVKKMVALSDGKKIDAALLSPHLRQMAEEESLSEAGGSLKDVVEGLEKRKIVEAIERTKGNKSRAAELLGLSRLGLRKKMERYGLGE